MTLLVAALVVVLQIPVQGNPSQTREDAKAGIEGYVVRAGTNEPISVQLMRSSYDSNGQRRFAATGISARTNDRGEYRIYWVTPGRYYVTAGPNRSPYDQLPIVPTSNEVTDPGYVLTYYPGTTDASTAAAIDVQPGAEVSAIDFTLSQQQLFRVRGRIVDSRTGQFPRTATILVLPRDPSAGPISLLGYSYNSANGTFELRDVAPGSYVIHADAPVNQTTPDFTQRVSAQATIDVFKDIENVVLTFTPGISISGHLSIEGGTSISSISDYDRTRVLLTPVIQANFSTAPSPSLSNDGSFKIDSIQVGDYRIQVIPMPQGMYLKEARIGSVDVANVLSVSGPVSGALEVLI